MSRRISASGVKGGYAWNFQFYKDYSGETYLLFCAKRILGTEGDLKIAVKKRTYLLGEPSGPTYFKGEKVWLISREKGGNTKYSLRTLHGYIIESLEL